MNAYSIVHNFDQPVYTPDFQFVSMALGHKQQKLDTNRQKLQNLYDSFSSLDVYRDDHKQYLENRLKDVLQINSRYHNMDLSDDNFASVVAGNVTQIADDIVKAAVMDTRIIRAEDAEWEKQRLAADGKYNERNHQYALYNSDRRNYANAQELGRRYKGGAGFITYTDYNKKYLDNIDKVLDRLKVEEIQQGPQQGHFRSLVTREIVTAEKIKEEMAKVFDQNDMRQMQIDGWYQYSKMPAGSFQEMWNSDVEAKLDQTKDILEKVRAEMTTKGLTEDRKENLQNIINQYEDAAANIEDSRFENLIQKGFQPENLYGQYYTSKYIDSIANTHARDIVKKIDIDEVHKANVEFNHEFNKWQADLLLKEQQEKRKDFEAGAVWDPKTRTYKAATAGSNEEDEITIPGIPKKEGEEGYKEIDPKTQIVTERQTAIETIQNILKPSLRANLSSNQIQEVIATINNNGASFDQRTGTWEIKVSGNKVSLSEEDYINLTNAALTASTKNIAADRLYKEYKQIIYQTRGDVTRMIAGGNTQAANATPALGFRVVKDQSGKLTVQKENPQTAKAYYLSLLNKRAKNIKLSEEEQKTVDAYTALSMANDKGFGDKTDRQIYNDLVYTDILLGVGGKKNLPKSRIDKEQSWGEWLLEGLSATAERGVRKLVGWSEIGNTTFDIQTQKPVVHSLPEGWGTDYTQLGTERSNATTYVVGGKSEESAIRIRKMLESYRETGQQAYLNEAKAESKRHVQNLQFDLDRLDRDAPKTVQVTPPSFGNYSDRIKRQLEAAKAVAEEDIKQIKQESNKGVLILPGHSQHANLSKLLSGAIPSTIDLKKVTLKAAKNESGNFVLGIQHKPTEADPLSPMYAGTQFLNFTHQIELTPEQAEQYGLSSPERGYNLRFDMVNGDAAVPIPLGNTSKRKEYKTTFFENKDILDIIKEIPNEEQAAIVKRNFEDFNKGNLRLQATPINYKDAPGYYFQLLDRNDQPIVTSQRAAATEFKPYMIVNAQRDAVETMELLFLQYIQEQFQ